MVLPACMPDSLTSEPIISQSRIANVAARHSPRATYDECVNQPPAAPREFLTAASAGTRVVVRYKVDGGFTDALGDLLGCSPTECTVRTRSADVVILLEQVVAAKQVPPPPARRSPRT
jgi:hypothetical protein